MREHVEVETLADLLRVPAKAIEAMAAVANFLIVEDPRGRFLRMGDADEIVRTLDPVAPQHQNMVRSG